MQGLRGRDASLTDVDAIGRLFRGLARGTGPAQGRRMALPLETIVRVAFFAAIAALALAAVAVG